MSDFSIKESRASRSLKLEFIGRMDAWNTPCLDLNFLEGIDFLELDFSLLTYISSAGLRLLLTLQKDMKRRHGEMVVRHVSRDIVNILDMTGFSDILNIEWT